MPPAAMLAAVTPEGSLPVVSTVAVCVVHVDVIGAYDCTVGTSGRFRSQWGLGSKSPRRCPSCEIPSAFGMLLGSVLLHLSGGDRSRAGHGADRKGVEDAVRATPTLDFINRSAAAAEWRARPRGGNRDGRH